LARGPGQSLPRYTGNGIGNEVPPPLYCGRRDRGYEGVRDLTGKRESGRRVPPASMGKFYRERGSPNREARLPVFRLERI
jgi:hypothetical protein